MCNPHGCTPTSCTGVPAGSKLPREVFRTLIRHQIKTRKKRSLSSQVTYNPDWPWKLQTTTKNNSKNQPLNYHRDSYTNLGYWESTAMRYTPEKWSFDTYHGFYIAGPIKGPPRGLSIWNTQIHDVQGHDWLHGPVCPHWTFSKNVKERISFFKYI